MEIKYNYFELSLKVSKYQNVKNLNRKGFTVIKK